MTQKTNYNGVLLKHIIINYFYIQQISIHNDICNVDSTQNRI
ncbi:hypothetical protein Cassandra_0159 [Pseudomonas phage Cassandra]|nr:hypothetical protein Cassandra_0159 [Pseudomonas phage Cassandra]